MALAYHWAELPDGIDLLLTHGPPLGVQDQNAKGKYLGDAALAEAVQRVRPRLHVFGHIHESYGVTRANSTTFVNASVCTTVYEPIQAPIVVELDEPLPGDLGQDSLTLQRRHTRPDSC
jgi:Icc-related predicted phosphoesterase